MGVEGVKKSRGGYDNISASHWGGSGGLSLRPGIGRKSRRRKKLRLSGTYHRETAYFYTGFRNTLALGRYVGMHRHFPSPPPALPRPLFPVFLFMNSMSYVRA